MVQTTQSVSSARTQEEEQDLSFNCYQAVKEAKASAKENLQLAASLYNSINNLCTTIERLDNLMENIIFTNEKEKSSPQAETFD